MRFVFDKSDCELLWHTHPRFFWTCSKWRWDLFTIEVGNDYIMKVGIFEHVNVNSFHSFLRTFQGCNICPVQFIRILANHYYYQGILRSWKWSYAGYDSKHRLLCSWASFLIQLLLLHWELYILSCPNVTETDFAHEIVELFFTQFSLGIFLAMVMTMPFQQINSIPSPTRLRETK